MSDYDPKPLQDLIAKAECEGKWLRSNYQGVEFSPKELRQANAEGRFNWGPANWTLFDPKYLLQDPEAKAEAARRHNAEIRKRMAER